MEDKNEGVHLSLDVKAWRSILTGWSSLITKDFEGNETIKAEIDWSNDDDKLANYNNMALNTIFNRNDAEQIKLIFSCESTKEAWDILQTMFEGSSDVKRNKLLTFTTRFKNLHMLEEESLSNFYTKLCDIANESFALGEKIPASVLVRKSLDHYRIGSNQDHCH